MMDATYLIKHVPYKVARVKGEETRCRGIEFLKDHGPDQIKRN